MKEWEIIDKEDVSPSKEWFPVERQTVKLGNGTIKNDYFISPMRDFMGDIVMILPITSSNEIVLVKQYKHAAGKILIELPAGFQQKGKSVEESALAELEEETGIKTTLDNLIFLGKTTDNPTKIKQDTYCYLAKNLEFNSTQNLDATEDIEILRISPQKTLDMVKNEEIWVTDSVANILRAYIKYPEIFNNK